MPRNKLVIGMASYARGFLVRDRNDCRVGASVKKASPPCKYTRTGGFIAYYEVSLDIVCRFCMGEGGGRGEGGGGFIPSVIQLPRNSGHHRVIQHYSL